MASVTDEYRFRIIHRPSYIKELGRSGSISATGTWSNGSTTNGTITIPSDSPTVNSNYIDISFSDSVNLTLKSVSISITVPDTDFPESTDSDDASNPKYYKLKDKFKGFKLAKANFMASGISGPATPEDIKLLEGNNNAYYSLQYSGDTNKQTSFTLTSSEFVKGRYSFDSQTFIINRYDVNTLFFSSQVDFSETLQNTDNGPAIVTGRLDNYNYGTLRENDTGICKFLSEKNDIECYQLVEDATPYTHFPYPMQKQQSVVINKSSGKPVVYCNFYDEYTIDTKATSTWDYVNNEEALATLSNFTPNIVLGANDEVIITNLDELYDAGFDPRELAIFRVVKRGKAKRGAKGKKNRQRTDKIVGTNGFRHLGFNDYAARSQLKTIAKNTIFSDVYCRNDYRPNDHYNDNSESTINTFAIQSQNWIPVDEYQNGTRTLTKWILGTNDGNYPFYPNAYNGARQLGGCLSIDKRHFIKYPVGIVIGLRAFFIRQGDTYPTDHAKFVTYNTVSNQHQFCCSKVSRNCIMITYVNASPGSMTYALSQYNASSNPFPYYIHYKEKSDHTGEYSK